MHVNEAPEDWATRSQSDLVAHIIDRHHEALRRDMPVLIATAHEVGTPHGLADALEEFWSEMQQHMMKEEQVLFPMLARGAFGPQVYMPVRVMEREHEEHALYLDRFRQMTRSYTAPADATAGVRALYVGLATLERQLQEHIHLENDILFPRATSR